MRTAAVRTGGVVTGAGSMGGGKLTVDAGLPTRPTVDLEGRSVPPSTVASAAGSLASIRLPIVGRADGRSVAEDAADAADFKGEVDLVAGLSFSTRVGGSFLAGVEAEPPVIPAVAVACAIRWRRVQEPRCAAMINRIMAIATLLPHCRGLDDEALSARGPDAGAATCGAGAG